MRLRYSSLSIAPPFEEFPDRNSREKNETQTQDEVVAIEDAADVQASSLSFSILLLPPPHLRCPFDHALFSFLSRCASATVHSLSQKILFAHKRLLLPPNLLHFLSLLPPPSLTLRKKGDKKESHRTSFFFLPPSFFPRM